MHPLYLPHLSEAVGFNKGTELRMRSAYIAHVLDILHRLSSVGNFVKKPSVPMQIQGEDYELFQLLFLSVLGCLLFKVKFALERAMKIQSGIRGIALLLL